MTPEGGRLVRHSEKLIAGWRAARQDVSLAEAAEQLVIGGSLRLWDALLQLWLHDLRRTYPDWAIIAESQTPDFLTRKLIDGTLHVAIMLEPAQLDIMQIREIATVEFILVSAQEGRELDVALAENYVFVDWGLTLGLDHRRTFPDASEAMTRVSHAKMALEYISLKGDSAYLPRRMVSKDIELDLLYEVEDAPVFTRQAYATFPVRSPRLDLVEKSLQLIRPV